MAAKIKTTTPDGVFTPARTITLATFDSPAELCDYAVTGRSRHNWEANAGGGWAGNDRWDDLIAKTRSGDLSKVAASDQWLAKMEESYPTPTSRKAWTDDVAGSVPNVAAFVAGSPLSMRRRSRIDSETAPLAVIVDVTCSEGIREHQLIKRGSVLLALVRALAARRPVELWVGCALGTFASGGSSLGQNGSAAFVRINTTPLDLASAAHLTSHAGVVRALLYGVACRVSTDMGMKGSTGAWAFNSVNIYRKHMAAILAPAFTHVTETLVVPPIYLEDPCLDEPEKWLAEQMAAYSPGAVDLADVA